MSRIWEACFPAPVSRIRGTLLRLVESQEQVATNSLVDSASEQAVLEEFLERSKPPRRPSTAGMPYLLHTPFRYPPLRHGSRFGARFEPSMFYGSREQRTVLAEAAFYRFWFWSGMSQPPRSELVTQHTVFRAGYDTPRGIRLQRAPFSAHEKVLRDPADYREIQALGRAMRTAGISAFEYVSARDPGRGLNIGLFSPRALTPRDRILGREEWACSTAAERVVFFNVSAGATREFHRGLFLVDGRLPSPAA